MNECFNCQKPHVGCHVECSEYAKVSAKAKIERTGRQSQYSMDNYFFDTNRRLAKL